MLLWYMRDKACVQITPLACEKKIKKLRFLRVPESRRRNFIEKRGMVLYIGDASKESRNRVSNYYISMGNEHAIHWLEYKTTPWTTVLDTDDELYCYWPECYGEEIKG